MSNLLRLTSVTLIIICSMNRLSPAEEIQPWPENPWYWSYRGQPVLLLGGSDDDNLFQWPAEKLIPQLDRIAAAGGNVVRNTMSDRKDGDWEVYPFAQRADGKYDLDQWNDEYWSRFAFFLQQTKARAIFVQIEVWDRFDYSDVGGVPRWRIHPYNPVNNINYTAEQTGLSARYPDHPGANKQPFFFSTPGQRNIQPLLQYQHTFVNKMLDIALQYDHVLYCIDNETRAEPAWGQYWAEFIRRRASERNRRVSVTQMWDDWDLSARRHKQTFDHPDLYDFVDVSQNNHNKGRKHWENLSYVRDYLSARPRPMNTTKTYGADGNKFGHADQDAIERFWRHLLGGAASIRFHRPDSGLGINDKAVACLRAARRMTTGVPVWNLVPATDRLTDSGPNECYAAATESGSTVVMYFPAANKPRQARWSPARKPGANASQPDPKWSVLWIDIDRGSVLPAQTIEGNLIRTPEGVGNVVAVLKRLDQPLLSGELLDLAGRRAFVLLPEENNRRQPQPWVMYAPTLLPNYPDEHERWMHQQFVNAGIAVAGVDVGEAYGNPESVQAMTDLYHHLTRQRGFADRPVVLGRSRGGLWVSQWASRNISKVAGLAGIYPVFDLTTYPGLETAAQAYELSAEQLQNSLEAHNPIAQVHRLAAAAVPVFLIHGAPDHVVPLEPNSATVRRLYEDAGNQAAIDLEVVPDQGHNHWPGFFRSKKLVEFVVRNALPEQP